MLDALQIAENDALESIYPTSQVTLLLYVVILYDHQSLEGKVLEKKRPVIR